LCDNDLTETLFPTIRIDLPDKAKPFVRRGRKAAGLKAEMAELPKDKPEVSPAFFIFMPKRHYSPGIIFDPVYIRGCLR
jgi:hypothetical protein